MQVSSPYLSLLRFENCPKKGEAGGLVWIVFNRYYFLRSIASRNMHLPCFQWGPSSIFEAGFPSPVLVCSNKSERKRCEYFFHVGVVKITILAWCKILKALASEKKGVVDGVIRITCFILGPVELTSSGSEVNFAFAATWIKIREHKMAFMVQSPLGTESSHFRGRMSRMSNCSKNSEYNISIRAHLRPTVIMLHESR